MTSRVQGAFDAAKNFTIASYHTIREGLGTAAVYGRDGMKTVAEVARPYFHQGKTFAQENRNQIKWFVVGAVTITALRYVFNQCFGKNNAEAPRRNNTTTRA